jgi:hypothetical protein
MSPLSAIFIAEDRCRLPIEVTAGSRATDGRKPRQAREGAAVAASAVCRGGAWLSLVSAILLLPPSMDRSFFPITEFPEINVVSGFG